MNEHLSFDPLSPELLIAAVESFLSLRLDGTVEPFPSYINRVYGVRTDDGEELIAKFYRPDRWSPEAIVEEHQFLRELSDDDVPVVAPIADEDGDTLFEVEPEGGTYGFPFAVFPKRGGRSFDAEGDEEWMRLGAIVGRVHSVGLRGGATARPVVHPETWTASFVTELTEGNVVHEDLRGEFVDTVLGVVEVVSPLFDGVPVQRLHGDCHRGNILERSGEGLLLIDFDDMMVGPAVQDVWLLLPDYAEHSTRELNLIQDGYEHFAAFDRRQLELIEPLRFMRMVHFLAWQARQRHDDWFQRSYPEWGNRAFWIREVEDLREQARRIRGVTGN